MSNTINNRIIEPYFCSCANIISEVSNEFLDFTGYVIDDLLGKSLYELGQALKINSQFSLDNISGNCSGYIFTKSLEVIEVDISLVNNNKTDEKKYTFVEKLNSRLSDKLTFINEAFLNNKSGVAIYDVNNMILLKANQEYLNFQDFPFSNSQNILGNPIADTITDFAGSNSKAIFDTVLETQKTSYIKDLKYEKSSKGITYWECIISPIFENKKIKYIFVYITDVTQSVLSNENIEVQNKIIQQQKKQLESQNMQLEQQNTRLINVLENLSEGVLFVDNKGKFLMVNPEAKRLVYKNDIGSYLYDALKTTKIFDMKGNEIFYEDFPSVRALKGEIVKNLQLLIVHPEKEYFVEISSIPVYDAFGNLSMVVTCFHDITQTIKQSKIIDNCKKELEDIIENIADGITLFDKKGNYTLFNKSEREMFYPYSKNIENIDDWYNYSRLYNMNGDRLALENTATHRIMRGEKITNMRMTVSFPNKTFDVDVSGTPIYDSEGNFSLGVLCSRDMTGYYKREEAINSRFQILNRIIDTFDLPVVRLSCPDLSIVNINKKAFNILKLIRPDVKSLDQIRNTNIKDLYDNFKTSECYQFIVETLKENKTKHLNKKTYWINEKQVYWNIIFEPVGEVNGKAQELLILIIDVTREITCNIEMEKALQLQGEFLVNISHELKTPLNVIFATAQLFNVYCTKGSLDKNKDSIIKYIESIKQNSYRLSKMINNIVDLSKIEAGFFKLNLSNKNIVEYVEEIVTSVTNFTDSKGLNITFDTNIEEKIIACDPEKVERVVLNLISNAIKFTDVGDEILVTVKDKGKFVEISVEDNGIGIEYKYLNMIFDRFKQVDKSLSRNAEGTGIGLSLVKSIVELHGGTIHVESEFGKGSKFTFTLPSIKVLNEDNLYNSEVRSGNQNILVELSDV
ncbi:PAS domain-containing protein [Clostridium algoriphilum]|uniref:ATP-binding protein n=1 Tax=Clostridium algoriphilum TaxID=198347 RepID=UPI001CF33744|nr:ATP-binding protein [Clostridium algoriphilum]MCB2293537.1 PAS domain-containing protein [Clostridium algoriphilum]